MKKIIVKHSSPARVNIDDLLVALKDIFLMPLCCLLHVREN